MYFTECPRDAMQGIIDFIPTATKANYLNQLLKVGFDTIDFGSFVSSKAIPQMQDTNQVIAKLDFSNTQSKLLAIVANERGASEACEYEEISFLGFPLSLSETFQIRNTNKTILEAHSTIEKINQLCVLRQKKLVIYLSMGFGNPYGDPYNSDLIIQSIQALTRLGIEHVLPSDTIGVATPENIQSLFKLIVSLFPDIKFGAHLHSEPNLAKEKLKSAYQAGCRKFDTSILGIGGCPMATSNLIGNIATEKLIDFLNDEHLYSSINIEEFAVSKEMANAIFNRYH
ncbi:MAG: hydroxymethylglutaryl-CoA lyase [Cytophagales bacterium]|nr:MAG: hydroxymethylglutaryl-CoA lyase [Cytophagales bacterium]